jgi:xylitol oxidase
MAPIAERNWAGNLAYRARRLIEPRSVEELQSIVRASDRLRALGSRHSFNDIADTDGDLVALASLPRVLEIDRSASTVTVDGGVRYGELAQPLNEAGLALHNLASLPHISVAGACATGTHGSGTRLGSLATAVTALEHVRPDGELATLSRADDPETFPGAVVSLGALGIVSRMTLSVEPSYEVRQDVYEDLDVAVFAERFDEIATMAESVSFFSEWRAGVIEQVWLKSRVRDGQRIELPPDLYGAIRATVERHPMRRLPADNCTPQLGVPGPWHERMPHFRMGFNPSAGDELQSEYLVAHEHAVEAFMALDAMRDRLAPLILVSEVRTIAADDLWLSPAVGRASVALHFTWVPDWPAVRALIPAVEAVLEPFDPRPHWGKLFTMDPAVVRSRYERMGDFIDLASAFDPEGKLLNDLLRRVLFSASARAA